MSDDKKRDETLAALTEQNRLLAEQNQRLFQLLEGKTPVSENKNPNEVFREVMTSLREDRSPEGLALAEKMKPVFHDCRSHRTNATFRCEVQNGRIVVLHDYAVPPIEKWPDHIRDNANEKLFRKPMYRLMIDGHLTGEKAFVPPPGKMHHDYDIDWSEIESERKEEWPHFCYTHFFLSDSRALVGKAFDARLTVEWQEKNKSAADRNSELEAKVAALEAEKLALERQALGEQPAAARSRVPGVLQSP
jgi:hypothetical protein